MGAPWIRVVIGVVGLAWGLASETLYYRSGAPAPDVLRDLAVGWTYLYGGLAIWSSRPTNPTGRLMTLVGFTWFIGNLQLSDIGWLDAIGTAFADVIFVCLIALILAYPTGHLETTLDRVTVVILAIGTTVNNAIRLIPMPSEVSLDLARLYVGVALASFAGIVVIRRWIVAPARRRGELLPVLIGGTVLMGVLITSLVIQFFEVPEDLRAFLLAARGLAPAAIPLALLVGFYRQSELRQRALLDAIPDLMIRFTRDGHYLDIREEDSTLIARSVDPMVSGRIDDLLPTAAAASLTTAAEAALDTGSIQTLDLALDLPIGRREFEMRITPSGADEVTAILRDFSEQRAAQEELRRSRARIVEATDAERQRLERDLHDGAQQRLISTSLALRVARSKLGPDADPEVAAGLQTAADELRAALVELRELARGIHPAILTEAGLAAAIDSLAERSTVPVEVTARPDRRLPAAVEATAYFVVSEALANVAKYASAGRATVSADCQSDSLRVEVADDGVGGADARGGSGLRGLTDRVAAIGGSLSIDSPAGGGTRVVAEIPLEV
jgi:signal transduction histidine kinase